MTNPNHTDTSRSGDLVAVMKDQLESWEFEDPRESWWKWQHQYAQAADRIEALEAEVERLREALANLANTINIVGSPYHKAQEALDQIVTETKRAARAALGEKQ